MVVRCSCSSTAERRPPPGRGGTGPPAQHQQHGRPPAATREGSWWATVGAARPAAGRRQRGVVVVRRRRSSSSTDGRRPPLGKGGDVAPPQQVQHSWPAVSPRQGEVAAGRRQRERRWGAAARGAESRWSGSKSRGVEACGEVDEPSTRSGEWSKQLDSLQGMPRIGVVEFSTLMSSAVFAQQAYPTKCVGVQRACFSAAWQRTFAEVWCR